MICSQKSSEGNFARETVNRERNTPDTDIGQDTPGSTLKGNGDYGKDNLLCL